MKRVMVFSLPRIHHAVRYFLLIAIAALTAYWYKAADEICMAILGPCFYLASLLKNLILQTGIISSGSVNPWLLLVPITLFYFGFLGFLFKELWNERGPIRMISIFGLAGFLAFVHFKAWDNLMAYFKLPL